MSILTDIIQRPATAAAELTRLRAEIGLLVADNQRLCARNVQLETDLAHWRGLVNDLRADLDELKVRLPCGHPAACAQEDGPCEWCMDRADWLAEQG